METIVYSKAGCTFCTQAKDMLKYHGIDYKEVKLQQIKELKDIFSKVGKVVASFPQVILRGKHVGGFENLRDKLEEPLLIDNPNRFTVFPIKYPDMWDMYKKSLAVFWTTEEIDFSKDPADLAKMNPAEIEFVKTILAFFAASDGIVMENLVNNFCQEVQVPEARQVYATQTQIESIHCVSPDTRILTESGYFPIGTLEDKVVKVWNGEEFSEVTVVKTGDNDKLLHVTLSNGMELDCTEGHNWFIRKGNPAHPECCKTVKIPTLDLVIGDVVSKYLLPRLEMPDPDEFLNPYTHGFFCGDGTFSNGYPQIHLYGVKKELLPYLVVSSQSKECLGNGRITCYITHCINKDKFFVPINYSIETKLMWLEGLLDADGCINLNPQKTATSVQLGSINFQFLQDVQLMLSTLGISSNISVQEEAHMELLPDGKGGTKEYSCQKSYVMYISGYEVSVLSSLGFSPKRLVILTNPAIKPNPSLIKVVGIEDRGMVSKTFCFNEPLKHAGVFNGVLTGQSEAYSLLIDSYVKDPKEKDRLFRAIETMPAIKAKAEWALKWLDPSKSFGQRLVAFICVEGLLFSSSFCSIFYLKKRNLLPALAVSNDFISRDEGLHQQFGELLYSHLRHPPTKNVVESIVKEAVEVEKLFVKDAIKVAIIGMNETLMCQYVEFVADSIMKNLGFKPIYNSKCPFDFMEQYGLDGKVSFFEKRNTEYSKTGVMAAPEDMKFGLVEDF
jgi:ribonucleotide reductase beta subunit family protein with ferritin-like domain